MIKVNKIDFICWNIYINYGLFFLLFYYVVMLFLIDLIWFSYWWRINYLFMVFIFLNWVLELDLIFLVIDVVWGCVFIVFLKYSY